MPAYINHSDIPLSIAVWLATDHYDYDPDPNHLSATTLLRPLRQIILSRRLSPEDNPVELESLVNSRMGTAIHDSIEKAWKSNKENALRQLGYPEHVIQRVKVNPLPSELEPGDIPVYMEQRLSKEIDGFRISGKFDFVADGGLEDFKSTSVFSYMSGSNDEKYRLQGSIYRWLDPQLITKDEMKIQFIFTDWSKVRALSEASKGYPSKRVMFKRYSLMSYAETELWVRRKLAQIKQYADTPEAELPYCTDEELWRKPPVYKYYRNPKKTARATKNFDTLAEAQLRLTQDGGTGLIVPVPGEVTACRYCPVQSICSQAKQLIKDGSLVI
jgi:hypothetical protein